MKTIVIATDFSHAANNATAYGVALAKDIGAEVLLLHVCTPLAASADMIRITSDQEMLNDSRQLLQNQVIRFAGSEVKITARSVLGSASSMIISIAQEVDAAWIIVGMKAKDKSLRKIFGSTAVSLARHMAMPLIIVPENAAYYPLSKIALVNDLEKHSDVHALPPLQALGKDFDAYMFVVKVTPKSSKNYNDPRLLPIRWHLKELHASYEFLNDLDIATAVNNFVADNDIDMVAMVAHQHTLLERIFIHSHIKEMIYHTSVPFAVLPEQPTATNDLTYRYNFNLRVAH
ncbi:universal stress protein [Aridibaculum aurantiacum]|uniref:universal stress protein n=1 Tax=Aridibaculum aurantiacum TaxID=2810307 RepID=UPI001A960C1B|nr:universal stress protein [Aridibaculum aurantiacum]